MGLIPDWAKNAVPKIESNDSTIEIVEPPARTITSDFVLGISALSLVVLFIIDTGILNPAQDYVWLPLGIILFLMAAHPIITLEGFWEAIAVLLFYGNMIGFTIVFFESALTNAIVVSFTLLLAVVIVEFPRRFNIDSD